MRTTLKNLSTWHLGAAVSALLVFAVGNSWGQTNVTKPAVAGNRYLLVVETSRVMEKRLPGILQTLQDLLGSTLSRELRAGDSIGTWTYSETLNTGKIPLQRWNPGAQNGVIGLITNSVAHEKFNKQGHLERVVPTLGSVVAGSPVLTVVLVCSGTGEISGTPFDDQVNGTFKRWRDQQQTKRMPFVVVFRAANGKMTGCGVAPAPWPLELPTLPEPPPKLLAETLKATNSAPVVKKTATLPPLIVSGRKPQAAQTNAVFERPVVSHAVANLNPPTLGLSATEASRPEATLTNAPSQAAASAIAPAAAAGPSNVMAGAQPSAKDFEQPAPSRAAPPNEVARASVAPSQTATPPGEEANAGAAVEIKQVVAPPGLSTVVPRTRWVGVLLPMVLAVAGLAAAVAGWFHWQRGRSRVHRPLSLITRSLEQKS